MQREYDGFSDAAFCLVGSNRGELLAWRHNADRSARVVNLTTGQVHPIPDFLEENDIPADGRVFPSAVSPDGRFLASKWGWPLYVTEIAAGKKISRTVQGMTGCYSFAFSRDSEMWAYGCGGGVGLRKTATGKQIGLLVGLKEMDPIEDVQFSADGRTLVGSSCTGGH